MTELSPLADASDFGDRSRVLHVDDDADLAELTATFLEREAPTLDVETVTSADDALDRLDDATYDCIISDYEMPGMNGIEFLEAVRATYPELPFILYTGKGSEEVASDAISAGVTDYLQKEGGTDQYAVLANRVTNVVGHFRSEQLIERSEKRLREIVDALPHLLDAVLATGERTEFDAVEVENAAGETRVLEPRILPYEFAAVDGRFRPATDATGGDGRAVLGVAVDVTDRTERERELEQYEAYLEGSTDIITVLDENGVITYESPSLARILDHEPGSLTGENGFDIVHPDDREAMFETFLELVADPEGTVTVEARFQHADGSWRWLEVRGTNHLDHEPINGIVTNNRDVTERKRQQAELERTSDLLGRTERIADVGGWEIDTGTMEVFWTDHLFDLLQVDYDEEPPLDAALDVYHEEDRPVVQSAIDEALATGDPFDVEVRFLTPDDEVRWLRIQGLPVTEDGEVVRLRGAVQDITEQREREAELERARENYEALFDSMNDTAWVTALDGSLRAVNDAAVETTGYTRDELLTMSPTDIDPDLDAAELRELLAELRDDETQIFETVHETKSGERIPVEISSTLISYHGETAALSIARDISERAKREQRLEEFASVVSHDLRNPLSVAEGHLNLARSGGGDDHLEKAARALTRMNSLIDDLLTMAREGDDARSIEPVALADLAEQCWKHVATGEATLRIETDRTIRADRSRLQQFLENLVRNSVEHGSTSSQAAPDDSVEHGSTGDRTGTDDAELDDTAPGAADVTVTVGDLADGFYVEDDGPGIPEEHREDVFTLGYTTSPEGTGFGLNIVRQIAEAHGWTVTATEGVDGGARFEVTGVTFEQ